MSRLTRTAALLRAARAGIEKPGTWIKRAYALDAKGELTNWDGADARSFCLMGALYRWAHDDLTLAAGLTWEAVVGEHAYDPDDPDESHQDELSEWNDQDERTHAEVLAALDRAAALAEERACVCGRGACDVHDPEVKP